MPQQQPQRKPSSQPKKFTVCPDLEVTEGVGITPFCKALAEGRECTLIEKCVNEHNKPYVDAQCVITTLEEEE